MASIDIPRSSISGAFLQKVSPDLKKEAARLTRSQVGDIVGKADQAAEHVIASLAVESATDPKVARRNAHAPQLRAPKQVVAEQGQNLMATGTDGAPQTEATGKAAATSGAAPSGAVNGSIELMQQEALDSKEAKEELDASGTLVALLGELAKLCGDAKTEDLKSRTAIFQASMQELQKTEDDYQAAVAEMTSANAQLKQANADAIVQQIQLSEASAKLDQAKQAAGGNSKDPEVVRQQANYDQLYGELGQTLQTVTTCSQQANAASEEAAILLASIDVMKLSTAELQTQQLKDAEGLNASGKSTVGTTLDQQLDAQGELVALMGVMAKLIGDNNDDNMKAQADLQKKMNESRQADLQKQSDDMQKQLDKQAHMQKAMGCVGKILGALLMVAGAALAVFSGGASLALFAVGVALTVADKITKAVTGTSFMAEAMKPIADLMQKFAQLLSNAVTSVLENVLHVPKDKAEEAGAIIGGILAAAAVIVVMVAGSALAKSAAAKLDTLLGKVLGKAIGKMVPDVLKKITGSVSKGFARLQSFLTHDLDEAAVGKIAAKGRMLHTGASSAKDMTENSLNIAADKADENAEDDVANMHAYMAGADVFERMMDQAQDVWKSNAQQVNALMIQMSETISANLNAGKSILSHIPA